MVKSVGYNAYPNVGYKGFALRALLIGRTSLSPTDAHDSAPSPGATVAIAKVHALLVEGAPARSPAGCRIGSHLAEILTPPLASPSQVGPGEQVLADEPRQGVPLTFGVLDVVNQA